MVMNGFDTNFDRANEVYAVNTVAFAYKEKPIQVKRGELVRIYLVNVLEYDLLNTFHIHANFFHVFPTGTSLEPTELTDTVVQGQGQRDILELRFPYTGKYMFHAHVREFAELGWMGFFEVDRLMEAATAPRRRAAGRLGRRARSADHAGGGDRPVRGARRAGARAAGRAGRGRWWSSARCCGPGEIELHVRNDGADPVEVKQVFVNDALCRRSTQTDGRARPARGRHE